MIIVGLTGSIASGKSTVSEMFQKLGAYLIDYDILAREIVEPHAKAWQAIIDEFGSEILNKDLTLNREKLGQIVFDNPDKLAKLNQLTHPAVFQAASERVEEIEKIDPEAIIIKDVPLLIETGIHKTVDKVIVVSATKENRLQRLMDRSFSHDEAEKRIASQLPIREKVKHANFVIHNDGSIGDTQKQVREIFGSLKDKSLT